MSCSIHHTITGQCTGFHDIGALAFSAYSAASDGCVDEARRDLSRYDNLVKEGVQTVPEAVEAASAVRDWLARTPSSDQLLTARPRRA